MSIHHARNTRSTRSLVARTGAALALTAGLVGGMTAPAQAAVAPTSSTPVLQTADSLVGAPYRYGGTTPGGFDCSGYTSWVFAQVGVSLPRTANDQKNAAAPISAGEAGPGDLVFFTSGSGRAYHVAIYAGNGRIYDAGSSGGTVKERAIWSKSVSYGRVLA